MASNYGGYNQDWARQQAAAYRPPTRPPTQNAPRPQQNYGPPQQQQYYQDEQRRIAQQQAQRMAQQRAAQQAAAAQAAIEARRQTLADQAKQKQKDFNSAIPGMAGWGIGQQFAFQPENLYYGAGNIVDSLVSGMDAGINQFSQTMNSYEDLVKQQGGWQFENLGNVNAWMGATQPGAGAPVPGMAGYQLPQQDVYGRGYVSPEQRRPPYPWMEPGYYMTQQQINTLMGQTGATVNPAQQYLNPPGPRGQRGPYTPQDERQWAMDRDTNNQFQGVTKGYESRLLYGMPDQDGGSSGSGWGYPSYGGWGGGGGYTPYEPTESWYENMLNWNIG